MRRLLVLLAACGSDGSSCPLLPGRVDAACATCSQPMVLGPTDSLATELVLTPDTAAWLQSESVEVVPLAGGTPTELGEARGTLRLHGAGTRLAWVSGTDMRTYAPGEGIRVVGPAPLVSVTRDFAVDDAAIYMPIEQNGVKLAALAFDGTTQRVWSIAPLAVLTDAGGPLVTTCGGVFRAPTTGTVAIPLVDGLCGISLAATAKYIIAGGFSDVCNAWAIVRIDRATGTSQALVADDNEYPRIATDGEFVYFANPKGLFRVHIDGGEPAMLLPGTIESFAVDATAIYALSSGSLLRITK